MKNENLKKIVVNESISPSLKELFSEIGKDFKLMFSKSGRAEIVKENHHKHLFITMAIVAAAQALTLYLGQTHPMMIFILGFFLSLLANLPREIYLDYVTRKQHGYSIFSWRDVRYGVYGGFLGAAIVWAIGVLIIK